jgi:hypothetical protein
MTWHIETRDGLTYLFDDLTEWMVDDHQRQIAMADYASKAHGDTLVGGLGLGLLTMWCMKNPNTTTVTTVEIDPDLIDLVGLGAIQGDFWEFAAQEDGWDTIIADLWPDHAYPDEDIEERLSLVRTRNPQATIIIHGYPVLSDA